MSSIFSKKEEINRGKKIENKSYENQPDVEGIITTGSGRNASDKNKIAERKETIKITERKKNNEIDSLSDTDNEETYEHMVLSYGDIIKTIPSTATKQPNPDLQKTHTEWRWRFFNLKGRKLVEITKKSPSSDRIYMDDTGRWVTFDLKGNWEQFLVDSRYYYAIQ